MEQGGNPEHDDDDRPSYAAADASYSCNPCKRFTRWQFTEVAHPYMPLLTRTILFFLLVIKDHNWSLMGSEDRKKLMPSGRCLYLTGREGIYVINVGIHIKCLLCATVVAQKKIHCPFL